MKYIIYLFILLLVIPIVSAEDQAPVITSISPDVAYNVGVTIITINGNHFAPGCQVYLVKCGKGMIVGEISSYSPNSITATFNIKGISPGTATIKLYNSNTLFTSAPQSFTILGDATSTPTITPTTNTIYPTPYYTSTPSPQSSETPEPEETITYIYNIPTPTIVIPLDQRGVAKVTTEIPSKIQVAETTVKPPTPQIVKVKPTQSLLDISIGIISLLCIIIIRRK